MKNIITNHYNKYYFYSGIKDHLPKQLRIHFFVKGTLQKFVDQLCSNTVIPFPVQDHVKIQWVQTDDTSRTGTDLSVLKSHSVIYRISYLGLSNC